MLRPRPSVLLLLTLTLAGCAGAWREKLPNRTDGVPSGPYLLPLGTEIEYPDMQAEEIPDLSTAKAPRTTENPAELKSRPITLPEAVRHALRTSEVLRNLGGSVVQAASGASVFDTALAESDPNAGVEAALSAFDTQLTSSIFWNTTERPINQTFPGLFLPTFTQFSSNFTAQLAKTTAVGSRFAVRHNVGYNRNNNPSNRFPSAYDVNYEAEWRHPLLQGSGLEFNRIAGPNGQPGSANGVLLARLNTDVSLADFEAAVINQVRDVERAFWELYFAYRDLEARLAARESALTTWRNIAERAKLGLRGGEPESEAQARAQYYLFDAQVQEALSGDAGLYSREEQLRLLLGLTPNDGELLRPEVDPLLAGVEFRWGDLLEEALTRRVELRRQKWQVKRRELELVAAKNHLLPRLDGVALYRWVGFGDHLLRSRRSSDPLHSAYQLLTGGDFQEWQLGVELNVPIGFRRAAAGLRNAELRLARERAVLREQELRVAHELSAALRNVQRSHRLIRTNFNRRVSSQYEVDAIRATFDIGRIGIDVLLQAQQRLADSNSAYYRSVVDYNLALSSIQERKGSLLQYNSVNLSEGPWSEKSHRDAHRRSRNFLRNRHLSRTPRPLSVGAAEDVPLPSALHQTVQPAEEIRVPPADPQTN